jgi:transcriptional regulator with XRE-family HTH domain
MPTNAIRDLRKARKMTQAELAAASGTTRSMLFKLESGRRTLNGEWLEKIGAALGVPGWQLIAPPDVLPSADDLESLIEAAQDALPQGLPFPVWRRMLAAELAIRLRTLAADRALD